MLRGVKKPAVQRGVKKFFLQKNMHTDQAQFSTNDENT